MKAKITKKISEFNTWLASLWINLKLAFNVDLRSALSTIFFSLLTGIAPIVLAVTTGILVGQFMPGSTISIGKVVLIFAVTYSMLQFGRIGMLSQRGRLADRITKTMSERLMQLPSKWRGVEHFENKELYDKIATVDRLIGSMASVIFGQAITSAMTSLGTFILLWVLDWRVAVISSVVIIPIAIWQAKETMKSETNIHILSPEYRKLDYLLELSTEAKTAKEIKLLNAENFILDTYQRYSKKILKELWHIRVKEGLQSVIGTIIGGLALGGICWLAAFWSLNGQWDPVKLAIFFVAIREGQRAVSQVYLFIRAFSTLTLVFSTMSEMQNFKGLPSGTQNITEVESLAVHNMSFVYPGLGRNQPALSQIEIHIKRGEIIVIVGENGAGKSSLIKLLTRMYDPTAGTITINGDDLRQFNVNSYRSLLASSLQDVGRFPLTLKENIFFGRNDAADNIADIFKKIDLTDYVAKLPKGENELVGRQWNGIEMSGGQWQKIGAARVLARKADLLILDEPNTFLDAHAEAALLGNIVEHIRGNKLSCIFITHRLGAARIGDRILVMQDGKIIESGTHKELLETAGRYSQLWLMQKEQYQMAD